MEQQQVKRTRTIFVTFQKEGIHCYPAAGTNPKLATGEWDDVSFLANDHRHMFGFKVEIEVFHDDRDLEFIQEKRFMERIFDNGTMHIDHKSCEMLCDELYEHLAERYDIYNHPRKITIEVNEDGENGARTVYEIN